MLIFVFSDNYLLILWKPVGGAADPFTGGSGYRPEIGPNAPRYLPGDAQPVANPVKLANDPINPDRYVPSGSPEPAPVQPKIEFVDRQFFPETKMMPFNDTKPGVDKILKAFQDKCAAKGIEISVEELAQFEMMTGFNFWRCIFSAQILTDIQLFLKIQML